MQVLGVDPCLLHGISVAYCNSVILKGLVVDGDAERCSYSVLSSVAFSDRVFFFVLAHEVVAQGIHYLAGFLRHAVFFDEWEDGGLIRGEHWWELHDHAFAAVFEFLFVIGVAHHGEEHTVEAYRSLDDVRGIALVSLRVEILEFLA